MGILNVTPDSFSDGGAHRDAAAAIAAGLAMVRDGAAIVDVGGESTRPGSSPTPPDIERARIIPVIRALAEAGACVSVDTRHAGTMRAALHAGARIVNDISGLRFDPDSAGVVAQAGCSVVLMHMRGTPDTMQSLADYDDVVADVTGALAAMVAGATAAGIATERIVLDPGIGFAKTATHNLALLRDLPVLRGLARPLLIGVSRKGFIGHILGIAAPRARLGGSLAAALFAAASGASILRVHDVAETVQALRMWGELAAFTPMAPNRPQNGPIPVHSDLALLPRHRRA
jgi:dihydropteroate synthase